MKLSRRIVEKQLPNGSLYLKADHANCMIHRIVQMEKKIEYVEKLLTQRLSATKELNNIRHRKRVSKLIKEIQELREKLELSKE